MGIKTMFAAFAGILFGTSLVWGQCTTFTTSTIRNCNGIDYELWSQDNAGTITMQITGSSTAANGGTFEVKWNGTKNMLARGGKKWGASSTTTAKSVGNISLEFAATWNSVDNVKMLGVYGWAYYPAGSVPTKTEIGENTSYSNQIEYYIIQDRGSYNPASGGKNAKKYGSGTIDGIAYDFWVADRLNEAMLTGKGNFKQYFSVPQNVSSHRQSGTVSISKHFEAWEKAGMKIMDCPLYEVAMKIESYTGSANGDGSAKVTKNLLTLGGTTPTDEFSLTTSVSPAGAGTITKSPNTTTYAKGTAVQLTAAPNKGWKFVGWEGDATGSTSTASVTMSKDLAVTAKFVLESGDDTTNLIKDGKFPSSSVIATDDGASWKLAQGQYWGNSVATASVSNGVATIDVTTLGTETYQPQLVQYGVALEKGQKYKLTFTAKAASERKIEVSFQEAADPWTPYGSQEFALTTTDKEYEYIFTMANDSDPAAQFAFNLGQATGKVDLSNVKLVYTADDITPLSPFARSNAQWITVQGRTLNINAEKGTKLQVKIMDPSGKLKANFSTTGKATHSLSSIPSGRYYIYITGQGVKQMSPIVVE